MRREAAQRGGLAVATPQQPETPPPIAERGYFVGRDY
jgi:hypothetical protein